MALGDADLAAGVFFADTGETIIFGSQQTKGNFDAPGKDANFGGVNLSDQDYRIEVAKVAFNPFPGVRDALTVASGLYAGNYEVRALNPMGDGKVIEILLRSV